MSLGRLLAAGKSLVGLRGGESRYREDKQARLPKFISPKNPFAPAEKPAEQAAAETPTGAAAKADGDEIKVTLRLQPAPTPAAIRASGPGRFGGWRQKLGRFRFRRAKPGPFGNAAAEPSKAMQSELALDRVQVVRNDLSDADLASTSPPQPPLMMRPVLPVVAVTMEKLEPMGAAWNRLATKFLGSDQT